MARRAAIAAGGTGGHFYPGLVLAQTLRARGWQPLLIVRRGDPALPVLEREGIAAVEIDLRGLPRRLSLNAPLFFLKLARSLLMMRRILKDFHPDVVVGMGGYLTFPAVTGATIRGIPCAVHESNSVLGLANRISCFFGAKLFWGLPPAHGSGRITGTPIRPALHQRGQPQAARRSLGLEETRLTVLVFGGSQGARQINRQVPRALKALAQTAPDRIQTLHLSGSREAEAEEVKASYAGAPMLSLVLPFLESMESAYAAADLVICRAGAGTLAELAAQGKPAVLIPYPDAAAGHQKINARVLEKAGAAALILEPELPTKLMPLLVDLLLSDQAEIRRTAMSEAFSGLGIPPAERTPLMLAQAVEELAYGKT